MRRPAQPWAGTTAALFALVSTGTSFAEQPGRIGHPGLAPRPQLPRRGHLPHADDAGLRPHLHPGAASAWLAGGAEASGRFLAEVGLPMPHLNPEHAVVLKVTAV